MSASSLDVPTARYSSARFESALVREVRRLTERQRRALGVSELQLAIADLVFSTCARLIDNDDARPVLERLDDLEAGIGHLDRDALHVAAAAWSEEEPDIPPWLKRAGSPAYRAFLRRFMGAARFDRLASALRDDGAVVFVAARRALRYALPLAGAIDSCIKTLSPNQTQAIDGLENLARSSMLWLAVDLDKAMNELLDSGKVAEIEAARPGELIQLPGLLGDIVREMSDAISVESARLLEELNSALAKKVQGARDALRFSADPISQAANSLVELIDRLLRDAFGLEEVVEWVQHARPDQMAELIHERGGQRLPTKRAQALCFVYAGDQTETPSLLHELAAASLVAVRTRLQALKHADRGTEAEMQAVVDWLVAIESAVLLVCKFAWLSAEEQRLDVLRRRLAPAA